MKAFSIFLIVGFLSVASSLPVSDIERRWEMIPTEDGHWHMVDVNDAEFQAELAQRAEFPVKFYLYTRSNPNSAQEIFTDDMSSLTNSYYSAARPTRILIHGWNGDRNSGPGSTIRPAYLNRGDFNVIVVDWGAGAQHPNYIIAKNNVPDAGRKVAAFMDFLNSHGTPFNNIYIVGHSLGAHVSGFAGKYSRGKPNTIFGLDAAMPMFNFTPDRLAIGDAEYVESIHTNGGLLGFDVPLGDSSFYPAWGGVQPGCGNDTLGGCSHGRAVNYFAESLAVANNFLALNCDSYENIEKEVCPGPGTARMGGEPSNHSFFGVFYVPVNPSAPYATGRI